ncbi:hypothetical protein [Cystobacter fuscus]|uniref:hypothetical protein n=1 Tax=Cystobacter fuscus TaxID=43 RepID=UPI0005BB9FB1|nr:hypothetical protein [Cystobacter fuscus]
MVVEVFALSVGGFTGSGQFALLALAKEGVAPLLINLAIFSASSEIAAAPGPALLGLGILGVLTLALRTVPILVTLIASTAAFLLLFTALNR